MAEPSRPAHASVLAREVIDSLSAVDESGPRLWLDGTLGLGGHAEALMTASGPDARLLAFDKDPYARAHAQQRLAHFGARVKIVAAGFESMAGPAREFLGTAPGFDGILLDLGVSSMQLDAAERGFSFMRSGPLDMRMNPEAGLSASRWLDAQNEDSLVQVLREYGEVDQARRLARGILAGRPYGDTLALAQVVENTVGRRPGKIHPATLVFQALRIAVNQELEALDAALPQVLKLLKIGGRMAVISFHSLEDRRVKAFIRSESIGCICPPDLPLCVCGHKPRVAEKPRRAIMPGDSEIAVNPRARSAKLRVAERLI